MNDHVRFPKTPRVADVLQRDVFSDWKRCVITVEEKVDGANVGIRWSEDGIILQSRGHVLQGGAREAQFAPLHGWAAMRSDNLEDALGTNFMVFGEWCYAKHRAFYDALPDLFLGFDVLDLRTGEFLTTPKRDEVLARAAIQAVPRLHSGAFKKAPAFGSFLGPSKFKTKVWRASFMQEATRVGVRDPWAETDNSDWMEGVYVRVEDQDRIVARMKLHREGFEKVRSEGWGRGPFIRNQVAAV